MSDKSKNKKNPGKGKPQKGSDKSLKEDTKNKNKQHNNNYKEKQEKTTRNTDIEEPVDTLTLFANLKRETDEILRISQENERNKYSKRQITSNWTKYELPTDTYDIIESQEDGADFEQLLQMPTSQGGHFQFKHEKAWTSDKKNNKYKDLFTLNLNYISTAMSCVPFYERNNLDPSLFSNEQRERMNNTAAKNMNKFKKNLPVDRPAKDVTSNKQRDRINSREELTENDAEDDELEKMLVGSLRSSSSSEAEEVSSPAIQEDDQSMYDFTANDLMLNTTKTEEGFVFIKVPNEPAKSPEKLNKIKNDHDDELDEILGIKSPEAVINPAETSTITLDAPIKLNEKDITSPSKPSEETKMDLDKWLDDYLDS